MLNPRLSSARDAVCNLYIEELTNEQLFQNYYCRTCGHLKGNHNHFLTDVQKLYIRLDQEYSIDEAALSITSESGKIQIFVYPPGKKDIEQQTSKASSGKCPVPWPDNKTVNSYAFSTLSKKEASTVLDKIWTKLIHEQFSERAAELENTCLTVRDKNIHWNECIYSKKIPPMGHSLWISMHGGGGCPALENDQQYRNQITLYNPTEGIWVVPRGPTNNWNLWHEEHIDPMFDRIIENYIMVKEINPNRVYILGYSAGGDGVYKLAPRMADRFAAAGMMAGHPNDASPLGLRNLPFAIFVGERDSSYNRNAVARQWSEQLDALEKSDPDGYHHYVNICADMDHWMCGRDAEALPWMAQWARNPWPKKVVWVQDSVTHDRFYWISLPPTVKIEQGQTITAEVHEQTIFITVSKSIQQLTLRLSDTLLDLDQSISVFIEEHGPVFQGRVSRTEEAIEDSLRRRADPTSVATALLELVW